LERFAYRASDNYWEFLGDWAPPKNEPHYAPDGKIDRWPCRWSTPEENQLFNTMSYAHQTRMLAEIAEVLGKQDDAARYAAAAGTIRQAVRQKWFDRDKAAFPSTGHPQTYLAFALLTEVVPCELQERVTRNLEAEIVDRWQGHLDTGVLGSFYLIEHLLAQNRSDLIYRIAMQPQPPSWRAMLEQGATTIWEHWVPAWSSVHNSFLSIGGWFIPGIAGIRLEADSPGFREVTIRPQPVGGVTWAKAEYDSVRGRIAVHWRRKRRAFEMDVALPVGTTANVYLPIAAGAVVTESNVPLAASGDVKLLRREDGHAVLKVDCGTYSFRAD
jgi:alpha-L-rhamnosidase